MTTAQSIEISPPADDEELKAFRRLADYSFASNPPLTVDISRMQRQGRENFRLARVKGKLAGGLGLLHMGQWFGGRSVPTVGINAVTVAPEYRSAGIASTLLRGMLEEAREQGYPLSTLYPATQLVYRRAGYEQAGVLMQYQQPAHALDARHRDLTMRPMQQGEEPVLHDLYAQRARRTGGNLDRSELMWHRVLNSSTEVVNTYIVERDGAPEGYVVYRQSQEGNGPRNIAVEDLVALTPDAGRRLLTFLGDHRSVVDNVLWMGSPAEPLLLHLTNQDYKVTYYEQWMLRVVDVRGALEARGYPEALSAELHLEVRDDVLGWNNGRWVLTVSEGRAEVREAGEGRVRLDVRGLAPVYSGYLSPHELASTAYIEGSDKDLATMALIFSGPSPWMPDGF